MLKAPQTPDNHDEMFVYQICISGSTDKEPFHSISNGGAELSNNERIAIIRDIAREFAEPFCSFLAHISDVSKVKKLELDDYVPHKGRSAAATYTLVGDAAHAMSMCTYCITRPTSLPTANRGHC